jgi:hypothetical protein
MLILQCFFRLFAERLGFIPTKSTTAGVSADRSVIDDIEVGISSKEASKGVNCIRSLTSRITISSNVTSIGVDEVQGDCGGFIHFGSAIIPCERNPRSEGEDRC